MTSPKRKKEGSQDFGNLADSCGCFWERMYFYDPADVHIRKHKIYFFHHLSSF